MGQKRTVPADARDPRGESAARLQAIVQSAMDAIITVDEQQTVVVFNVAAERIFRCPAADAIGAPLERFLPSRFRAAHRDHVERFGETGATARRMGGDMVLAGLRADGEEFPIEAAISQVSVGERKLFTVILRDITNRVRAAAALERSHRELLELYAAMNDVREAERTRIARELHDELAQWLTAIRMDVSWLSSRLPRDQPQLADKAEKMKRAVDTTVAAVRRIAADLRPVMLDDLGLVPAIEHLLHDFSERSGIMISFDVDVGEDKFLDPLATSVYRMLQEALTNVMRHARASEVRVVMCLEDGQLRLRVRDNGMGISAGAENKEKSFGLRGIKERAHTLGGAATIAGAADGGTIVEIVIPMDRQRAAKAQP